MLKPTVCLQGSTHRGIIRTDNIYMYFILTNKKWEWETRLLQSTKYTVCIVQVLAIPCQEYKSILVPAYQEFIPDQERIREARSVQVPIYTMEFVSKTKLCCIVHHSFKNFHIRKFLDSRMTILMSWMAIMADSAEGTPCHHSHHQLPLACKSTKQCRKSETTMATAAHAQEKPKPKKKKNVKRVCEELDNVDKLLWDVLNLVPR